MNTLAFWFGRLCVGCMVRAVPQNSNSNTNIGLFSFLLLLLLLLLLFFFPFILCLLLIYLFIYFSFFFLLLLLFCLFARFDLYKITRGSFTLALRYFHKFSHGYVHVAIYCDVLHLLVFLKCAQTQILIEFWLVTQCGSGNWTILIHYSIGEQQSSTWFYQFITIFNYLSWNWRNCFQYPLIVNISHC